MGKIWHLLSSRLLSRAGAWVALLLTVVMAAAVLGTLRASDPPGAAGALPAGSESAAAQTLEDRFPHSDLAPVVAVFSRDGAQLSEADVATANTVGRQLAQQVGQSAGAPVVSEDGEAAIVSVMIEAERPNSEIADTISELRTVAHDGVPPGLTVQITGGPAFGADIASAFDGANLTLLAVTIAIVALLLMLTYRSPVLWLVPLTVVAFAEQVAGVVTARMGELWNLQFDAGIISVLVFGAGTNYALLLISRYREELYRDEDHRAALGRALHGTAPAILASNVTVVASLLTLVFAVMPSTRGLGLASAAALLIALVFALLVLPAALAVCGRRLFWPFIPRAGAEPKVGTGLWHAVARSVTGRPAAVVGASVVGLAVLASGLLGTRVGLSQMEQFRGSSESAAGLAVLAEHFPSGETAPMTIIADTSEADAVVDAAAAVPGVVRVRASAESATGLTRITAVGAAAPGTDADLRTVRDVRSAVHAVPGADAVVGGPAAQALDVKQASQRDLLLIAPMILGVALVLLVALLRAVVAPVLLILVNVASAFAAIGAGTWVGRTVFGFPALDVNVPLLAFLFLVALGIDYTIFLAHRARQEAAVHGTREGMVRAVSHTGAVITSAGVVLAAVFAALGVLPLTVLGQLGLIVGLGVLLDTLLVRTAVVPAVFALVGERIWWPGRPGGRSDPHPADPHPDGRRTAEEQRPLASARD